MRISISKVAVQAFRSCKKVSFGINEKLTVLIGPNGSGKTNLLQAILLLRSSLRRRYRGAETKTLALLSTIDVEFLVDQKTVGYHATIGMTTDDRNREEIATVEDRWDLSELADGQFKQIPGDFLQFAMQDRGFVRQDTLTSDLIRHRWLARGEREKFPNLDKIFAFLTKEPNQKILKALVDFRSSIAYYGATQFADPTRCPSLIEIDQDETLRRSHVEGLDHSQFIYSLYRAYKTRSDSYERYMSLVDKRGIGLIQRISWKEIKAPTNVFRVQHGGRVVRERRARTIVIPTLQVGNAKLSFNQLSEGTFKTLALLYYLSSDASSVLLLEEPEVCVHHGLLSSVIEVIKQYSARKQIVFSTHSDFVLDALQPEDILLVGYSVQQGTTVRPVSKAMSTQRYQALKSYLDSSGNLGEYWRHSGFDP